ncbi:hypothetical protein AWC13_13375 [Mycobacterium kubicae]|uniref:Ferredoxin n=1 Tax=Mycobacterium kubicae TaxID=120959 RepID=A0AAX1JGS0_9MYCO|nr:hypothetical protein [Mycobacterium kubicae]ORV98535.1 hypothetical protein AWC13_13375 [Mycobacterium kubicae]QNI14857.1 hypothetical protein GAN18_16120 [Mycobacterium kubicae]QPI40760.1 hypothetical protein I2456_15915 [Mycobacterium kubicae]
MEPRRCQAERAQGGGELARVGRAKIRTDMTQSAAPGGCECARCRPEPLTDIDAQRALRHVTNGNAAAYARGELTLIGCRDCEDCGAWVPSFIAAELADGSSNA